MAACRSSPASAWASQKHSCHCSCWSPPGVPNARTGSPPRRASEGVSVVRGRLPGARELGRPGSSQNIWARVPRGKPRSGTTGELCSQPPDGVAATMLPQRSTASTWQVSPRVVPWASTVGSPIPAGAVGRVELIAVRGPTVAGAAGVGAGGAAGGFPVSGGGGGGGGTDRGRAVLVVLRQEGG